MSAFGILAITYGLPGVAICTSIIVGAYARKNEKRINEHDVHNGQVDNEFKHINEKLDLVVNHIMDEHKK